MEFQNSKTNLCVICYKSVGYKPIYTNDDGDNGNRDNLQMNFKDRFFILLFRHLSNHNIISKNLFFSLVTVNILKNLLVCQDCNIITSKFCKLYDQIKQVELLMDFEIMKFCNVMTLAERVPCRVKDFTRYNSMSANGSNLVNFRTKLRRGCKAYGKMRNKRFSPRVRISPILLEESKSIIKDDINDGAYIEAEKDGQNGSPTKLSISTDIIGESVVTTNFQDDMLETVNVLQNESEMDEFKIFGESIVKTEVEDDYLETDLNEANMEKTSGILFKETVIKKEIENDLITENVQDDAHSEMEVDMEYSISSAVIKQENLTIEISPPEVQSWNPQLSSSTLLKCNSYSCSLAFGSKHDIFRHNVEHHIEKLFFSENCNTIQSIVEFKPYIEQLFDKIVDNFQKSFTKRFEIYKCTFCQRKHYGRIQAKLHLVNKHRNIMRAKILKLQHSNKNVPQLVISPNLGRIPNILAPSHHKKANKRFNPPNPKCTVCHEVFPYPHILNSHKALHHPDNLLLWAKRESDSISQFSLQVKNVVSSELRKLKKIPDDDYDKIRFKCIYCSKVVNSKQIGQVHLVTMHGGKLGEKLKNLQENPKVEQLKRKHSQKNKTELQNSKIFQSIQNDISNDNQVSVKMEIFNGENDIIFPI